MKLPINIEELLGKRAVEGCLASCHPEFISEKVVLNKDFIKDFIKNVTTQVHNNKRLLPARRHGQSAQGPAATG